MLLLLSTFFSVSSDTFSCYGRVHLGLSTSSNDGDSGLILGYVGGFSGCVVIGLVNGGVMGVLCSIFSAVLYIALLAGSSFIISGIGSMNTLVSAVISALIIFFINSVVPGGVNGAFPGAVYGVIICPLVFLSVVLAPVSLVFEKLV